MLLKTYFTKKKPIKISTKMETTKAAIWHKPRTMKKLKKRTKRGIKRRNQNSKMTSPIFKTKKRT
jgi:hypothetical protein